MVWCCGFEQLELSAHPLGRTRMLGKNPVSVFGSRSHRLSHPCHLDEAVNQAGTRSRASCASLDLTPIKALANVRSRLIKVQNPRCAVALREN